jgi:hypothetical protein
VIDLEGLSHIASQYQQSKLASSFAPQQPTQHDDSTPAPALNVANAKFAHDIGAILEAEKSKQYVATQLQHYQPLLPSDRSATVERSVDTATTPTTPTTTTTATTTTTSSSSRTNAEATTTTTTTAAPSASALSTNTRTSGSTPNTPRQSGLFGLQSIDYQPSLASVFQLANGVTLPNYGLGENGTSFISQYSKRRRLEHQSALDQET